jgi:hypothetical protein
VMRPPMSTQTIMQGASPRLPLRGAERAGDAAVVSRR